MSIVANSDKKELAFKYLKWFSNSRTQKIWWTKGGYSVHTAVMENPYFATTQPFASEFLTAMKTAKDFWQNPSYEALMGSMQNHVYNYVVKDNGTAQEALNRLAEDWEIILN
jgi:multiple sugar transport system substrate-binding protein